MIQQSFDELRTAVREGDRSRAVEVTARLMDEYDRDRARVRAQASLARSARETAGGTGSVVEAAQAVLETASRTNETKIDVDTELLGYLRGDDPDDLVATLGIAIETHDRFDERVTELRTTLEETDADTQAFVTVVAPNQFVVPKGVPIDRDVTIRNDTTETAEDVELSIRSDASLSLSPTTIDGLPGGETAAVTVSGTPDAGEYRLAISATVDGRTDSVSPYLLVQDKRTFLEQAVEELVELYNDLAIAAARVDDATGDGTDGDGGSGNSENGGRGNDEGTGSGSGSRTGGDTPVPSGIDNKIRVIATRTLEIIDRIEGSKGGDGRGGGGAPAKAIDNGIGSVINQIAALQNQISAQAGKGLSADAEAQLVHDAEALIGLYEDAQDAAI